MKCAARCRAHSSLTCPALRAARVAPRPSKLRRTSRSSPENLSVPSWRALNSRGSERMLDQDPRMSPMRDSSSAKGGSAGWKGGAGAADWVWSVGVSFMFCDFLDR